MLSLAMIVKDEEANLGRCLSSINGIFDEIIIVDTGSTDKTKEIAESFGAKVYDFEWINDFAAARNFAFSKATQDFVMWLDGDDVIKPADRQKLISLKPKLKPDGWYIFWYDYAQTPEGASALRFQRERIVPRAANLWKYPIHEIMIAPKNVKVIEEDITVTHMRSEEEFKKGYGRNIKILEGVKEKDSRMQFYYGKELHETNRPIEAIIELQKFIAMPTASLFEKIQAYWHLCICYITTENLDACREAAMAAIRIDPRHAEFFVIIGDCHAKQRHVFQAMAFFRVAGQIAPDGIGPVYPEYHRIIAWDKLANAYCNVGKFKDALDVINTAMEHYPNHKRLMLNRENIIKAMNQPKPVMPVKPIVLDSSEQIKDTKKNGSHETTERRSVISPHM